MNAGASGDAVPSAPLAQARAIEAVSDWRQRGLRPWFVEDQAKPMPVKYGMWLRRGTLLFIWIATLLILFAELAHRLNGNNDALWTVTLTVFLTFVHLSYLWLIFWLLILSSPPHLQYWQRVWYPSLLLVYCGINFIHALVEYFTFKDLPIPVARAWQPKLQMAALVVLAFYYAVWLRRDSYRRSGVLPANERHVNTFWLWAERVSLAFLLFRMTDLMFDIMRRTGMAGLVDVSENSETIVIGISLLLWVFLRWYEGSFVERTFRGHYQEYLRAIKVPVAFSPARFPEKDGAFTGVRRVLDFGCGDGTRLKENLAWLGVAPEALTVHGFDTNAEWESHFRKTFDGLSVNFFSSSRDLNPQNHYDLVVISHCLYDVQALRDATTILKSCDSGTRVLIRGMSPSSFFYFVSRMQAIRLITHAQASYSWYLWALPALCKDVGLHSVGKPDVLLFSPDAIVSQKFVLDACSLTYAVNLLEDLYGGNTRENVTEVLNQLLHQGQIRELPNDDLVYVFQKSG